jgi:hypothetical protein
MGQRLSARLGQLVAADLLRIDPNAASEVVLWGLSPNAISIAAGVSAPTLLRAAVEAPSGQSQ